MEGEILSPSSQGRTREGRERELGHRGGTELENKASQWDSSGSHVTDSRNTARQYSSCLTDGVAEIKEETNVGRQKGRLRDASKG